MNICQVLSNFHIIQLEVLFLHKALQFKYISEWYLSYQKKINIHLL